MFQAEHPDNPTKMCNYFLHTSGGDYAVDYVGRVWRRFPFLHPSEMLS